MSVPAAYWLEFQAHRRAAGRCGFLWTNMTYGVYCCERMANHVGSHRDGQGETR